ncbi:MAG: T9SS type A sorting domain-containing protein, partial [Cyclonatronaceae bacterium]
RLVRNNVVVAAPESGPAGSFTFPDAPGGDIFVGGDIHIEGNLDANNRALFLIGGTNGLSAGAQQLHNNSGAPLALPFLFVENPDGVSVNGDLVFEGFDSGGSFIPAVLDIAENAAFSTNGSLRFVNGAEIRLNQGTKNSGLHSGSITGFDISEGHRFSVDVEAGRPLIVDTELRLRKGSTLSIPRGELQVSRLVLDEGHLLDIEAGSLETGEISTEHRFSGTGGWRMIGPPATGITYQQLLSGVFTQGIPGATTPNGSPNVFVWNATGGQYEVPAALTAEATQAVLVFMFEESELPGDVRNGTGLPFSRVQGDGTEGDGTILSSADQRFHMVYNPFGTPVTLDEAAAGVNRSNLYNTFYIWDAGLDPGDGQAKGGWRFGNALLNDVQPIIDEFNIDANDQQRFPFESLEQSEIAPFQGFLVEAEPEAGPADFALSEQARRNEAAFIGEPLPEESGERAAPLAEEARRASSRAKTHHAHAETMDFGQPGLLGLALEHTGNGAQSAALLAFTSQGEAGFDGYDIRLRQSLNNSSMQLFSRSANGQRLRFNHLPQQLGEVLELPLDFAAGGNFGAEGDYRLSWPIIERIPARWQAELIDGQTNEIIDMKRQQEYEFTVSASGKSAAKESPTDAGRLLNQIMQADTPDKASPDRFLIRITPPVQEDGPQRLSAELSGPNEGWRMLSAPAHGITYAELLSGLWTQGFPGASVENGTPSVFVYDEASASWQPPASIHNYAGTRSSAAEAAQNAGKAALVYVFEDHDYDGTPDGWPKRISVSATPLEGSYEQHFSFTPGAQEDEQAAAGWHLAGNPFDFSLDWAAVMQDTDNRESGISDAVYIWDANLGSGGYRVFNSLFSPAEMLGESVLGAAGESEAIIAAFQGFWLKTERDNAALRLRQRHDHAPAAKQETPGTAVMRIALHLSGQQLHAGTAFSFTQQGREGGDAGDAPQLASLSEARLYFYSQNADGQRLSINNLPVFGGQERHLPLYVESSASGSYELGLGQLDGLPDETEIWLHDLHSGQQWRLEEGFRQEVYIESTAAANEAFSGGTRPVALDAIQPAASAGPRFELRIVQGVPSSAEPAPPIPDAITLEQNYPNPFNPVTRIEYGLPEAGPVRLEVFNMLGQRVALLVNEEQAAGYYQTRFDASALGSGVYLYRLQTQNGVRAARMTLIK